MLTEIQKATIKTVACEDVDLAAFLLRAGKFIMFPKILGYLLSNGITGAQLKALIDFDKLHDPENFVTHMNRRINGIYKG